MTTLSDLIARLEAAKEVSHELDALIAVAIFETQKTDDDLIYARKCTRSDNCAAGTYWNVQRSGMSLRTAPFYTTSLDAALTLVPERDASGCYWRVIIERKLVHDTLAWIVEVRTHADNGGSGIAHSAALAICIAALKAREAAK